MKIFTPGYQNGYPFVKYFVITELLVNACPNEEYIIIESISDTQLSMGDFGIYVFSNNKIVDLNVRS